MAAHDELNRGRANEVICARSDPAPRPKTWAKPSFAGQHATYYYVTPGQACRDDQALLGFPVESRGGFVPNH